MPASTPLDDRRTALVLGCAGQDGSYLVEQLAGRGYAVTGVSRTGRGHPDVDPVTGEVVALDLLDAAGVSRLVRERQPDEIYNCAAVTFGPDAWTDPARALAIGGEAFAHLLDAIRDHSPRSRLFQCSSSWVFGQTSCSPQDEGTAYRPSDPYGATKAYADFLLASYRERYGLFLVSGILFNHESPRRSPRFLTRKVTQAAARIARGSHEMLELGDLDASRDWGFAADFMDCAWRSLQSDEPADYVIGTGRLHSVADVLSIAFGRVGLDWEDHVRRDVGLVRSSADVPALVADAGRARERLGWTPTTSFEDLITLMVDDDLARLDRSNDPWADRSAER